MHCTAGRGGAHLYSRVQLMHELKQFVHNGLQKFPMGAQKTRVLAYNIHDVGGNDSLVVLAASHLAQIQQIPNHCDQELVLLLFIHAA